MILGECLGIILFSTLKRSSNPLLRIGLKQMTTSPPLVFWILKKKSSIVPFFYEIHSVFPIHPVRVTGRHMLFVWRAPLLFFGTHTGPRRQLAIQKAQRDSRMRSGKQAVKLQGSSASFP